MSRAVLVWPASDALPRSACRGPCGMEDGLPAPPTSFRPAGYWAASTSTRGATFWIWTSGRTEAASTPARPIWWFSKPGLRMRPPAYRRSRAFLLLLVFSAVGVCLIVRASDRTAPGSSGHRGEGLRADPARCRRFTHRVRSCLCGNVPRLPTRQTAATARPAVREDAVLRAGCRDYLPAGVDTDVGPSILVFHRPGGVTDPSVETRNRCPAQPGDAAAARPAGIPRTRQAPESFRGLAARILGGFRLAAAEKAGSAAAGLAGVSPGRCGYGMAVGGEGHRNHPRTRAGGCPAQGSGIVRTSLKSRNCRPSFTPRSNIPRVSSPADPAAPSPPYASHGRCRPCPARAGS